MICFRKGQLCTKRVIAFDVMRTHPNLGNPVVLREISKQVFRRSSAFSAPS